MKVKFLDKKSLEILIEKDYSDILPLLEMVKQKAVISIFFDQNGDKKINGRFIDFEYIIEKEETNGLRESLLVVIDSI